MDGKNPFLSKNKRKILSHPFFIYYSNNKPIYYYGEPNIVSNNNEKNKIWDYSLSEFIPINKIAKLRIG
jgi:hypothetical protein